MKPCYRVMILISVLLSSTKIYSQLRVKSNGDVKIGSRLDGLSEAKLEVSGRNETLEVQIYSTSPDIARLWALNSHYGFGFGVDQAGYGNIYHNVNSPSSIMIFDKEGNFGIGRQPSYKFDVNGNMRVMATIYQSDYRFMTNITNLSDLKLNNLLDLNSISYEVNQSNLQTLNPDQGEGIHENKNISDDQRQRLRYGFVPKEVVGLFPELVYKDSEGELGIDYISLIPIIIGKLKEQNETINELKEQLHLLLDD